MVDNMKRNKLYYLVRLALPVLILNLVQVSDAFAGKDERIPKRQYLATRTELTAKVDGKLDDPIWELGEWSGEFTQYMPTAKAKPSQPSYIKVLYGYDHLYVAIYNVDREPEKIRQSFDKRDQFAGDACGFALDSYYDLRTAFEFTITAAGQKIDLKHSGDRHFDMDWNANWEGATALADSGWVAEFKIPFSQIRYNNTNTHTWGLHAFRWIDRLSEESQWQYLPAESSALVYNFGELHGIQGIRESRQVEMLPYASSKLDQDRVNDNPHVNDVSFTPSIGLDAKIGLSSNFTLDATINPDFGQVEADPSVLNLDAGEVFFDEKRPFFLEGREIFDLNINNNYLFYSRRIGGSPSLEPDTEDGQYLERPDLTTILGSAKISGKTSNGLSIGVLETVTNTEFGEIFTTQPDGGHTKKKMAIEPLTNYFIGRVKKEANQSNTIIGATLNSVVRNLDTDYLKDEMHASAHTGGIDFMQYWKNRTYMLQANAVFSHLEGTSTAIKAVQESHQHRFQRPDADHIEFDTNRTSLTGTGGTFTFAKVGGQFRFEFEQHYWSPELNYNDLGFMNTADLIQQETEVSYQIIEPKWILNGFDAQLKVVNGWTFGGEHTRGWQQLNSNLTFKNLWGFHFEFMNSMDIMDVRETRGGPAIYRDGFWGTGGMLNTNRAKDFSAAGRFWYYRNHETDSYSIFSGLDMTYYPMDRWKIQLGTQFNMRDRPYFYVDTYDESDLTRYIYGQLDRQTLAFTFRTEFYIRPELSIQYYGSPFFSVGDYSEFKSVDQADQKDLNKRYRHYTDEQVVFNESDNNYTVTEADGSTYTFDNPDFSYGQFRSNLVFRWEYKLGSVFYLVWSHEQTRDGEVTDPRMDGSITDLFEKKSKDSIMLKFTYWFNI